MFILIGPDGTGKTTLAKELQGLTGMPIHHHTMNSKYQEYLDELISAKDGSVIMDRFIWCEYPYSEILNREFQYTPIQVQNITLFGLSFSPVVILCVHKPEVYVDDYLPIELWDKCLDSYKLFLVKECIDYIEYDYTQFRNPKNFVKAMIYLEAMLKDSIRWWLPRRAEGIGATGNLTHPQLLIVAERLGPDNVHYLPFETGPTGRMMGVLLYKTSTPLGQVAITNIVKAPLKDRRDPTDKDLALLNQELTNIAPKGIIFMGKPALKGIPVAEKLGIPYKSILHLGYYQRRGSWDVNKYCEQWRKMRAELAGTEIRQVAVWKSGVYGGEDG